ncbi:TonB-dependent receptor plug domain-containing protein [Maribellus comscasis]|uniref:TonB-dependent receptor plug domain-containing protein n=1 Tax=Maribellus comscasis TaxID=2681766 RepID=A0A6I6K663_9BACT|nr:TonB-dependent receptor plug domain-containing protein [Maribellus comscasis]QGY47133.1 TonB-dependent receptor plug domain-containing protein [Maribellus comscasis]
MRVKLLILMFLMLTFTTVEAQNLTDTIHIEEVKVLAKRKVEEAGLKLTRPDSMARIATLTTSLSELISEYTPVFIKSYGRGSSATASFRGTAATHTQVLWNGMNLNSPMNGIADLSLLPVFFTDDVYLLHGGSSMAESSGALGGSIHLNNQINWDTNLELAGLFETSSFQTRKTFVRVLLGGGRLKSSTRLFYEGSENNFPYYNYGVIPQRNDTLENADYWKGGILQEFYYRSFNSKIMSLRIWFQKSDRNLPQLMSYEGSEREEYQNDDQLRVQYDIKKYTDKFNYHFFTGLNSTTLNYYRATPEFNFVNENSKSKENGFQNHLRIFREFNEKTYATVSADVNYYQVQITNKINGEDYKKDRFETSLLINWHMKPSDRFAAFMLMRSENYDNHVEPFIPSAGFEWQVTKRWPLLLKPNVARNYHKPTLNDLYWLPGGNSDLLPEDGYTGDLSLSWQTENSHFQFDSEITGFVSFIDNWIVWQPSQSGAYYWEANNVKEVLSRGAEYRFSAGKNLRNLELKSGGNYSYTHTTNQNAMRSVDKSRGKQLIYIPKHKGNLFAAASVKNFTLKFDMEYTGKRYTNSSNEESEFERVLNPYWLNKVSLDKMLEISSFRMNIKFAVENIFNEDYQSILWRPMPGRYYSFSMALNYKK